MPSLFFYREVILLYHIISHLRRVFLKMGEERYRCTFLPFFLGRWTSVASYRQRCPPFSRCRSTLVFSILSFFYFFSFPFYFLFRLPHKLSLLRYINQKGSRFSEKYFFLSFFFPFFKRLAFTKATSNVSPDFSLMGFPKY